jgi:Tol biopolymer transport system component
VAASPVVDHQRLTSQFSDLVLSPDGKKVAFVARGDVFAGPARDGGDAERITSSATQEFGVVWARDSRRLFFVSVRDAVNALVSFDFATRRESVLITSPKARWPRAS